MHTLVLFLMSSIAAAQVPPEPFNAAWSDFDGDGIMDLAIGMPSLSGCSKVDIWLSSDGPFPYGTAPTGPLRPASLTLLTIRCGAVLGPVRVDDGDLVVGAYAGGTYGEHVVSWATIARNRGTLYLSSVAPPPQEPVACWVAPGTIDGWMVWECSKGEVYYRCEPCCGDSSCCITNICGG